MTLPRSTLPTCDSLKPYFQQGLGQRRKVRKRPEAQVWARSFRPSPIQSPHCPARYVDHMPNVPDHLPQARCSKKRRRKQNPHHTPCRGQRP